jgi:homoserine kinase type II
MKCEDDPLPALRAYPDECQPGRIEPLGAAGGFSGSRFWRIRCRSGMLCLRRWPREHPTREGLEFIHAVLDHAARAGFRRLPLPLKTRSGPGYVSHGGYLWELAPWLSGRADFRENPTNTKLTAAMVALAEFHRATSTFRLPEIGTGSARSPGIQRRLERLRQCMEGDFERLSLAVRPGVFPEIEDRARRLIPLASSAAGPVHALLSQAADTTAQLQPCVCDVWHDHILFQGDRVSGLVDFGTMRPETVAADTARLLGSMAADDATKWKIGLQAYESIRPLSQAELLMVRAFDSSTVLMAGLNWIDWIYRQGRVFENRKAVPGRLDEILGRLAHLGG